MIYTILGLLWENETPAELHPIPVNLRDIKVSSSP